MNLEDFIEDKPNMKEIKAKIRQRRSQMLVHSYLYYQKDEPIVSDDTWQKWANELRDLQDQYPKQCLIGFFDREFFGWTGDTGMHLPLSNPYVINKAERVLKTFNEQT